MEEESLEPSAEIEKGGGKKGKKSSKILGVIINVLLVGLMLFSALLLVVSIFTRAQNKSMVFGIGIFQIVSGSMSPEIEVNDVIIAKKVDPKTLKVGQNIVFVDGDKLITHKIIAVYESSVVTHGHANADGVNETVAISHIVGRQILRVPKLGYALNFMRSGGGFLFIIVLPLGGLIIYQTVTLTKKLKEYKDDKSAANLSEKAKLQKEIDELKEKLNGKE